MSVMSDTLLLVTNSKKSYSNKICIWYSSELYTLNFQLKSVIKKARHNFNSIDISHTTLR